MKNIKLQKSLIAFILTFFMIFSELASITSYGNLVIPSLTSNVSVSTNNSLSNGQVVINGSSSNTTTSTTTSSSTVIINDTNNNSNSSTITNTNTIVINNDSTTIDISNNTTVNEEVLEQVGTVDYTVGTTVQAKIVPAYSYPLSRSGSNILTLVGNNKGADASVSFMGDEAGATRHSLIDYITRENNDPNSVGYCISPFYEGAKENGTTEIEVIENLTDKDRIILGIAVAGYPHNKYNIAGYDSLSEEDKYYATLIAIEHYLFQNSTNYPNKQGVVFNNDSWTHWFPTRSGDTNAQKIITVAQGIYEKGVANPYNESQGMANVNFTDNNQNDGTMKVDGDNYVLTISINSDTNYSDVIVTFTDPIIKQWATDSPTKIQFYDGDSANGTRLYWQSHTAGNEIIEGIKIAKPSRTSDTITIVIDKDTADNLITGDTGSYSLDYDAIFLGGSVQVALIGRNTKSNLQDYSVITTGKATARSNVSWSKNSGGGGTPTPDPGKGGLKILKYNAKTNELVAGAIFKIRGISEDVYDFNVDIQASKNAQIPILNNGATVKVEDGVITIENLEVGTYEITEITPPPNFDLALGQNSQTVQVESETNATLYPQVRFENNPYGSLKIKKVDAITGEALAGAVIKISNPLFDYEQEFTTNANGLIEIKDLKQGTYEIVEVQAPTGYVLSTEVKTAIIKWGETTEITYENQPKTSLKITKIDSETGEKLDGAIFTLKHTTSGAEYVTEPTVNGVATITDLVNGTYVLTEIQAPQGYILDNTPQNVVIENNRVNEVIIKNSKKPSITINKVDSETKEPLANAKFEIWRAENNTTQGLIEKVGEYYTDIKGQITLDNLDYGWYAIKEVQAPAGYEIQGTGTYEFYLNAGESKEITIENVAKNSIIIKKVDADTGEPLAGAHFSITIISDGNSSGTHGTTIANVITNSNGVAVVTGLKAGGYIIEETKAPEGYVMVEQAQTVWLNKDDTSSVTVTFENRKNAGLTITKMDSITKEPLADAIFKVTDSKGQVVGTSNGLFRTDATGTIIIPNLSVGAYVVQEIQAPNGYILDNTAQTVHIEYGKMHSLEFFNTPTTSILIKKYDSETKEPLANAIFKVTDSKGANVGNSNGLFTTNENGTILVSGLKAGTYIVEEIKAPDGYILDNNSQVIEVENGKVYTLDFYNKPTNSLIIVKMDSTTKEPLANAIIKVTTVDDKFIGEYRTDQTGTIVVTGLTAGTYKVQEIQSPTGYVLDDTVKLVHLKQGEPQKVELFNSKIAGIQILKRDSQTGKPLAGAKFEVRKVNGELVGASYVTDSNGLITINGLAQGWYTIKEISAPTGYALNSNVQNVEVKTDTYTQVVFENDKLGKITISKIDYVTRKAIANVKFKVTKENGEVIGEFTTDKWGEIIINNLEPATYLIEEMQVPSGYALDKGVRKVKVETGSEIFVEWENYPLASLIIYKYDNRTNKPIANVEFEIFDSSNNSLGKVTTDSNGKITLNNKFGQGTYTIKETKAPIGYVDESIVRTVDLKWGKTTSIEIANTPIFGQIEIHKIGENNNNYTGQLDGENLAGAEFTIYDKATGKEVTKVTTNYNGVARTGELPYGTYLVKETKAPSYYLLNENEYEVAITENGEVVKLEVTNKSVELKTNGEKSTVKETKAGDTIRYDFNNLQNLSTVALENFYIHDSLPNSVTPTRLFTGTFNQNMKYQITYKTNMTSEFKVLQDNLFTNQVYEIDLTKGLQAGEYITDIRYEFDKVGVGFREVEKPFLYVKVNENVKKNEQFTNILTVGGRYDMQTVKSEDKFTTIVTSSTSTFDGTLPKTGY